MAQIVTWNSPEQAKKELLKRLGYARESRARIESRWEENEKTVYSTAGLGYNPALNESIENDTDIGLDDIDNSSASISVHYAFKNLRFIHAQLSANPPSVVVRPTSNDQDDRRKADAADRLVRYALRQYRLQERVDAASLNCLLYGTGFLKTTWDTDAGDILEADQETGELTLEGDIKISVPSTWNVFIDPDAETWEEARYVFERIYLPWEEAIFRWPEKKDVLEGARIKGGAGARHGLDLGNSSYLAESKYDAVELYEYWETGLPTNGYLGRFAVCSKSGGLVSDEVGPNPNRFPIPGLAFQIDKDSRLTDEQKIAKLKKVPQIAKLPYHIFTDVDVPGRIHGKSFIEYISKLQDTLNRLDSSTLDVIQAHGVTRLVLPEGAEIADDSITNSTWDIVKITGNQPPFKMEAPGPMPLVDNYRAQMKMGLDDVSGVNEAMFGQQSREQSGFSMQYATNQGNMIRRRLFNKYVLFVEGVYKSFLNLVRKHWTTTRTIHVLGKEKAFEAVDLQGADIDGGFDLVVEYGASLSLDPMTRREEIMALQPLFEKAGVAPRISLKMMKLNELEGMYDMLALAEDRQREIFEEMIATGRYIPPRPLQDHENMIAYGLQYVMTTEFKYLDPKLQPLVEKHIQDRVTLAAQEKAPPLPPEAPGPAGQPGEIPAVPGMQAGQASAPALPV